MTIGWFAATRRLDDPAGERAAAWDVFRSLTAGLDGGSNMNARSQWYQQAFARDDGAAVVLHAGVGRARGSIMATVRQRYFEMVDDPVPLLQRLFDGWHVSRLDLAADEDRPDRMPPRTLYDRLPAARSRSRPEHRVLTVNAAGDEKLTIGSRVSPRYARIYVKGDRVRHELELKQDAAGVAWAAIAAGSAVRRVWADEYGRLIRWH